jgi:hypothetical protein
VEAREAIRQAMKSVQAEISEHEIGDLEIAEYIVFLLALDTYMRYIEENTGAEPNDEVTHRGVRLLL